MDTIVIKPLGIKDYTVKVGDRISYTGTEHPSVGATFEYSISDEGSTLLSKKKAVVFIESKRVYNNEEMNNPDPNKPMMSGADEAKVTLLFEAAEIGKANLTIKNYYRGSIESTHKFEITVV